MSQYRIVRSRRAQGGFTPPILSFPVPPLLLIRAVRYDSRVECIRIRIDSGESNRFEYIRF